MKSLFKILGFILLLAAAAAGGYFLAPAGGHTHPAQGSASDAPEAKTLYTCGMHPQIIQDHPGNCPICSMKLTPIRKKPATTGTAAASGDRKIKYYKSTMIPGEISQTPRKDSMGMDMVPVYQGEETDSAAIAIDPVTIQNMGIRTGVIERGPLRRVIRTVGTIVADETTLVDVTTKFDGWIEKLYVDATGDLVHKGDPLFEIYSPELYSAQTEYLLGFPLTASAPAPRNGVSLKESARLKLQYFDISDQQIAELEQSRQPRKTLQVLAPIDGFVLEKMAVEGMMAKAGMRLYRLANLDIVWAYAEIYEQDLPFIHLGQEAVMSLSYLQDRKFHGRVTYIYPTLNEKTRTIRVRMEFHNPGYFLKPGMFANVRLAAELTKDALLVPDEAILRSGDKNTVFVTREDGKFEPRTVVLGARAENDQVQVLSGLASGERIVTSGQFMLDSESQLREAVQKMLEPNSPAPQKPAAHAMTMKPQSEAGHPSHESGDGQAAPAVPQMAYVCPMPEHAAIEYDHPGNCPICGMTLVPASSAALERFHSGGIVEYYTCPMPEHSDVKLDKPGKCPRCSMTLIPVIKARPAPVTDPPPPTKPEPRAETALPVKLYTCPMPNHADVVSDHPGKCPKCEMNLVETSSVKHGKIAEEHWKKDHAAPGIAPDHEH